MHIGKSYNFFRILPQPLHYHQRYHLQYHTTIRHNPPLYRTDADATVSECTVGGYAIMTQLAVMIPLVVMMPLVVC